MAELMTATDRNEKRQPSMPKGAAQPVQARSASGLSSLRCDQEG